MKRALSLLLIGLIGFSMLSIFSLQVRAPQAVNSPYLAELYPFPAEALTSDRYPIARALLTSVSDNQTIDTMIEWWDQHQLWILAVLMIVVGISVFVMIKRVRAKLDVLEYAEGILALILGAVFGHIFGHMDFGLWLQGFGWVFGLLVGIFTILLTSSESRYVRSIGAIIGTLDAFTVGFLIMSFVSRGLSSLGYEGWSFSFLSYEVDVIVLLLVIVSAFLGGVVGTLCGMIVNSGIRGIASLIAHRFRFESEHLIKASFIIWMIAIIGLSSAFYVSAESSGYLGKPGVTIPARGVKVGDWAKWDISTSWKTNIPNATKPEISWIFWDTQWMKLEVENISGNIVTAKTTIHFKNGKEKIETKTANVSMGSEELGLLIVPAGLSSGDTIFMDPSVYMPIIGTTFPINETVARNYAGARREVNLDRKEISVGLLGFYGDVDLKCCWDRATGLFCGLSATATERVLGYYTTIYVTARMSETNAWRAPIWLDWQFLAVVSGIIVAAFFVATLLKIFPTVHSRALTATEKL